MVDALKDDWKKARLGGEYSKSNTNASGLVSTERLNEAVKRAKAQHKRQQYQRAHQCQPCVTEIYRLVEELNKLGDTEPA